MSDLSANADVMAAVRKYGIDPKGAEPDPNVSAAPAEPAYVPPTIADAAGFADFKKVFGWKPKLAPQIPVRIFQDSDWPESIRPFIPTEAPNGDAWVWPREATEQLALAMYVGDRTLLKGPTGSGKSALVEAFCWLCRIPMMRVNCHAQQQSTEFLGKDIIVTDPVSGTPILRYDWSNTTIAGRFGGMLLIDEAFRSPVLMCIQSLLERNGTLTLPDAASLTPTERRIVPPAGRFWICLTDNTNGTGDESGAYNAEIQDISTLDRITATIQVDYIEPKDEERILKKAVPGLPESAYREVTRWAQRIRAAFLAGTIMQPISLRATGSILRKFQATGDLESSVRLAYLSKLTAPEAHAAREAYHQITARKL